MSNPEQNQDFLRFALLQKASTRERSEAFVAEQIEQLWMHFSLIENDRTREHLKTIFDTQMKLAYYEGITQAERMFDALEKEIKRLEALDHDS